MYIYMYQNTYIRIRIIIDTYKYLEVYGFVYMHINT